MSRLFPLILLLLLPGCAEDSRYSPPRNWPWPDAAREASTPDAARSDLVSAPDLGSPDSAELDAAVLDAAPPDSATPDSATPDAAGQDLLAKDLTTPDQSSQDGPASTVGFTVIKAGSYMMGSPAGEPCRRANEDHHKVTLTHDFELGTREVSQGEFSALMKYNPAIFKGCGSSCPVEYLYWSEAAAYCNALSAAKGLASCYSCSGTGAKVSCADAVKYQGGKIYACPGFRLPTEAEWEYAYRAGSTTAYHTGTNLGPMCSDCSKAEPYAWIMAWYCQNAGSKTHAGGLKQKNAWGLYDMAGNVWEWCHDWYQDTLGKSPVSDPAGPSTTGFRVYRGGSWGDKPTALRAAYRGGLCDTSRLHQGGFRCARTIN